ncbi:MAG: threonine aldolase family protein [Bacteroidales bacterium]
MKENISNQLPSFESDYTNGLHPKLLQRLIETNGDTLTGYGLDPYCQSAIRKIQKACNAPDAKVHLLMGGTQTNAIVISSMLNKCEGVISATTGHVSVHEAGAIEYTGHKVLTIDHSKGKIEPTNLDRYIKTFYADESHEHMVYPGMLYISQPTEYGTLYTRKELEQLYSICNNNNIPLFIDGARLGYALMSKECDMTLEDVANLCDVFYIGGTKVGAMCGEAIVFPKGFTPRHFRTSIKQQGALLAKGRLLGVQFDALFSDNLYMDISRHAIDMAEELKKTLKRNGCEFYLESPTNQQFIIMSNNKYEQLKKMVNVGLWEQAGDDNCVVRLVTSWSTTIEDIKALSDILSNP